MRAEDDTLYETMLKVENKDIFIDLKRNKSGVYLKISERNGSSRNTVLIPISGITRLKKVLDDVSAASETIKVVRRDRKQRVAGDPEVVARSVYVTGLTWDTEEDELIKHFSSVGPVVTAVVLRQRRNGNLKASMGCGVVEYETREAAAEAISVLNETELKGRAIRVREDRAPEDEPVEEPSNVGQSRAAAAAPVSKSVKKVPRKSPEDRSNVPEPNKVFVTSLTSDVTNELLAEYFSAIGTVVSAEILSTRKGRSICSGIVCFEDNASVTESIAKLSNVDFRGRAIVVREYFI